MDEPTPAMAADSPELIMPTPVAIETGNTEPWPDGIDPHDPKTQTPALRRLVGLLRAHPKEKSISDAAHAEWLVRKQTSEQGKQFDLKTFKNLMPLAKRIVREIDSLSRDIPRDIPRDE